MHTARLLTVSPSMHCAGGGCLLRGMPGLGGGGIPACTEADTPSPWTEFLTHATENIVLPQTSFAGGNKRFV